jgi:small subunit ribosomal protein S6
MPTSSYLLHADLSRIVRTTGSLVLNSGGSIRGIKNWGIFSLPKKTRKHQELRTEGHYFVMRYDASSQTQQNVRKTLGLDPRMIKFSSVKLGDGTLESISKISGNMSWNHHDPAKKE